MSLRLAAATGALLAAAVPAPAQIARDLLPPQPEVAPDPARDVAPREQPDTSPVRPVAGGPEFVLNGIVVAGNTAIPTAELAPIWSSFVGQTISLATLDEIVARISAAYRARGYVLSQAVLPAQTVAGGVVQVVVVEGFIDRIALTGGAANQRRIATKMFAPVAEERPLRLQTLERSVLLSRDTFGSVFGTSVETVLEPSPDTFAAADLGVLITPALYSGYLTADNRGSRIYGPLTLGAGIRTYNALGLNERIDGLVAYAPQDSSLAFGALVVEAPIEPLLGTFLDGARFELGVSVSRAEPDLAQSGSPEDLDALTSENEATARLIVPVIRTRAQNLYARLGLSFGETVSETEFAGETIEETDRLAVLEARLSWDVADRVGGVNLVDVALRQGLDIGSVSVSGEGPAVGVPDFTSAQVTLSRLQALGGGGWSLYGEIMGQYGFDVLPSAERFLLGNSTIGRGFAPGNTTGDSGIAARLELRRSLGPQHLAPAAEAAELYAFVDYGQAYDRSEARDEDQWESLGSVGIGARIDIRDWLSISPEIARQTDGVPTDTTDPDLETRFYLGVTARF